MNENQSDRKIHLQNVLEGLCDLLEKEQDLIVQSDWEAVSLSQKRVMDLLEVYGDLVEKMSVTRATCPEDFSCSNHDLLRDLANVVTDLLRRNEALLNQAMALSQVTSQAVAQWMGNQKKEGRYTATGDHGLGVVQYSLGLNRRV